MNELLTRGNMSIASLKCTQRFEHGSRLGRVNEQSTSPFRVLSFANSCQDKRLAQNVFVPHQGVHVYIPGLYSVGFCSQLSFCVMGV